MHDMHAAAWGRHAGLPLAELRDGECGVAMEIGAKIRGLRLQRGMTQEELADRCELTKGYISQLERDLASPSIATLQAMLDSLGSNLPAFFSESVDEPVVFHEEDRYVKESADGAVRVGWIVPDAVKRTMESIVLELLPGAESDEDDPHAGEEFGMVLQGSVTLRLGGARHRLRKGDCFQFKPDREHALKNTGKVPAKVLWLSSPPSF